MSIIAIDASGNVNLVNSRTRVGSDETILRVLTGSGHAERAEIILDILDN